MSITAQSCCRQIDEALEMFGLYSYYDKGPREVMMMSDIMTELNDMSATEVRDVLLEVGKHRHGKKFVSTVMVLSQDRPDGEFEVMEQACPDGW